MIQEDRLTRSECRPHIIEQLMYMLCTSGKFTLHRMVATVEPRTALRKFYDQAESEW